MCQAFFDGTQITIRLAMSCCERVKSLPRAVYYDLFCNCLKTSKNDSCLIILFLVPFR
jgi:hypothetical protein